MATARGRLSVGRKPALGYEVRRIRDDSSNPTTSAAKPPVFPGNTRVSRRLWRLTGRLTRGQGSAQDDAACASMDVQESQSNWPEMQKTLGKPGFLSGEDSNRTTYKFLGKLALRHHARREIRRAPISMFETTRNTIHTLSIATNGHLHCSPIYRVTNSRPIQVYRVTAFRLQGHLQGHIKNP